MEPAFLGLLMPLLGCSFVSPLWSVASSTIHELITICRYEILGCFYFLQMAPETQDHESVDQEGAVAKLVMLCISDLKIFSALDLRSM